MPSDNNEELTAKIAELQDVTRRAPSGANGELISVKLPLRLCRIGVSGAFLPEVRHTPVTSLDT